MTEPLCLLVEVPVCSFRPYASREYQDTYPVPTPASVYGMLLSMLGIPREHKGRHRGAEMAMAIESLPERSKVFRKLRRGADLENTRPDYQDVLTELRLWIWLRNGSEKPESSLATCMEAAIAVRFSNTNREGGLSLGESSYLVNSVAVAVPPPTLQFVMPDPSGFYSLPVWVDHATATQTKLLRFSIEDAACDVEKTLPDAWFQIPE